MADLVRDVRYGLRMLGKEPGPTVAAVLALGLGIGLASLVWSIVYGALLRGLPFERSDRLMFVAANWPAQHADRLDVYPLDFLAWRQRQTSFESLSAYSTGTTTLSGQGETPERFDGATLTPGGFEALRVRPLLGRSFLAADGAPQAPRVVLLSYGVWKSRYGGDRRVVGRPVRINGEPGTIVGVMPQGFAFPEHQVLWIPLRLDPAAYKKHGDGEGLNAFGRLRDGVGQDRAQAELTGLARVLEREFPLTNRGRGATVMTFGRQEIGKNAVALLWLMLGFGVTVLLIACANVASLMVARAASRTRELAVRSALGAGRRVIAQLLVESTLLAAVGAVLGVGLAYLGVELFNRALYSRVDDLPPFWMKIAVDRPSLLFTLGLTLVAGLVSGLLPALQAARADLHEVLKDEGRGSTSLRIGLLSRVVVIGELAFCCTLLVGAGLMAQSILNLHHLDLGFSTRDLLTVRVPLLASRYPAPADRARFFCELARRLGERPGVAEVAVTTSLPTNGADRELYAVEGRAYPGDQDLPVAWTSQVSPGYFHAFGGRLLAGRDFGSADGDGSLPVAIVDVSFARREWPGQDPLGRRVRLGRGDSSAPWRTVIGVVQAPPLRNLDESDPGAETIYLPLFQEAPSFASLVLRTAGDPMGFVPLLRREIAALDPDLPIYWVRSMQEVVENNGFFFNLIGAIFGVLGLAALVLAAVGIYGVISFAVGRRTQEIGIRMALGAQRGSVLAMILRQGALQLAIGLALGLTLALGSTRILRALLFEVSPTDPAIFALIAAVLAFVALIASLVPAQRAVRIDPLVALRAE